jgi:hypothetical protein
MTHLVKRFVFSNKKKYLLYTGAAFFGAFVGVQVLLRGHSIHVVCKHGHYLTS